MKITNICDNEHLTDCGLPDKIIPINGGTALNLSDISTLQGFNPSAVKNTDLISGAPYEALNTKAAGFETTNGESILVYYNLNCEPNNMILNSFYAQNKVCANFVYDLNGKKGPNTVGKDIGVITVLYSTDSVIISPNPYPTSLSGMEQNYAAERCKELDSEAKVPNIDELSALFYNKRLFAITDSGHWSSTGATVNAYLLRFDCGYSFNYKKNSTAKVRCIKR